MPADSKCQDWISAMMRLLGAGRQWRAARRRAHMHEYRHMSDRMLADIGVRRADIHAALSGLVPAQHIARTSGGTPWTAPVHTLRPQCREPADAMRGRDLSAAA
jgi:uncharacterized protein YjiS (DUF1127 family)